MNLVKPILPKHNSFVVLAEDIRKPKYLTTCYSRHSSFYRRGFGQCLQGTRSRFSENRKLKLTKGLILRYKTASEYTFHLSPIDLEEVKKEMIKISKEYLETKAADHFKTCTHCNKTRLYSISIERNHIEEYFTSSILSKFYIAGSLREAKKISRYILNEEEEETTEDRFFNIGQQWRQKTLEEERQLRRFKSR